MSLDAFVSKGWEDHAGDAAGVFARLPDGLPMVTEAKHVVPLAALAAHVAGEHLGRFDDGLAFLERLEARPACVAGSAEAKAVGRQKAALHFAAGRRAQAERCLARSYSEAFPQASDRVRALAVAASALAGQRRTAESAALLEEALAIASYGPTASDPAARALAVTGNNLSVELENRRSLDPAERALMVQAARTGLEFWKIAGTWLEEERAEYRLSSSLRKAGEAAEALRHATACHAIVEAHGNQPGEAFFAREALAQARLAGGDRAGARKDRDAAVAELARIEDESTRGYATQDLQALDAALGAA